MPNRKASIPAGLVQYKHGCEGKPVQMHVSYFSNYKEWIVWSSHTRISKVSFCPYCGLQLSTEGVEAVPVFPELQGTA